MISFLDLFFVYRLLWYFPARKLSAPCVESRNQNVSPNAKLRKKKEPQSKAKQNKRKIKKNAR
jgi:hypothetical protein